MNGNDFLKFLVDNKYIESVATRNYENPDIDIMTTNMNATGMFGEDSLVGYLNSWGKLPCEVSILENSDITLNSDIIEKNKHKEFERYIITPIEQNFLDGGSITSGGVIKVAIPFKFSNVVSTEYIRKNLKVSYQSSVWKIEIVYGLMNVCSSLHYKYINKFIDSSVETSSHLNLRQKIQKVFRESVKSGTMDIVFHCVNAQMTVLRKHMNEYHQFDTVKFTADEVSNFRNMLVGNFGGVEGSKVYAEPSLDFKIPNLNEDGKYEGRVNFMETKLGFQAHVRIIKLELNVMTLEDYILAPPVKEEILDSLDETMGLIIVTGPRGSGKQVLMYSCINEFKKKRPHSFIETLEDPIEARLDGNIAQIEIDKDNGRDYAYYLRGIKRHSTNMYMFGELRDKETVEAVLTEASSAALVLTTTHCADCPGIIKKMSVELKDDDAMLVKVINEFKLIVNLTMTRKACPKCKKLVTRDELTNAEKKFIDSWNYQGRIYKQTEGGCDHCKSLNYKKINQFKSDGNLYEPLIVVESLAFDKDVMELINQHDSIVAKEKVLREKMVSEGRYKTQMALGLVHAGQLTIEECMRHFSANNIKTV